MSDIIALIHLLHQAVGLNSIQSIISIQIKLDVDHILLVSNVIFQKILKFLIYVHFISIYTKRIFKVTVIFNEVTRHILLVSTNLILQKILKFLYTFYSSKFLKFLHYTLNYTTYRKNL